MRFLSRIRAFSTRALPSSSSFLMQLCMHSAHTPTIVPLSSVEQRSRSFLCFLGYRGSYTRLFLANILGKDPICEGKTTVFNMPVCVVRLCEENPANWMPVFRRNIERNCCAKRSFKDGTKVARIGKLCQGVWNFSWKCRGFLGFLIIGKREAERGFWYFIRAMWWMIFLRLLEKKLISIC